MYNIYLCKKIFPLFYTVTLLKGPTVSNMADFDFNLGTIESESDSSGDETYLVPTSKDVAKSMRSK